jgi:hypothetical protein
MGGTAGGKMNEQAILDEKVHKIISYTKELIETEDWAYLINGVTAILIDQKEASEAKGYMDGVEFMLGTLKKNEKQIAKRKIEEAVGEMEAQGIRPPYHSSDVLDWLDKEEE